MKELVTIGYFPNTGRYAVFDLTKRHENRTFTERKDLLEFVDRILEADYVGEEPKSEQCEGEPCDT